MHKKTLVATTRLSLKPPPGGGGGLRNDTYKDWARPPPTPPPPPPPPPPACVFRLGPHSSAVLMACYVVRCSPLPTVPLPKE